MNPVTALQRLLQRYRQNRTRRVLLTLNREQLKDIGLTRSEALEEGQKWFWQD
ncbi:DUF1127 domain-containing protein [Marinobacterium stanieri]|uniref:DUF1127 domain-containing protein n=1 Tax=Marinobacterium stanieri TaxID=49186 RepID=UPI000255A10E|nr:DUF1127 domain-containing protein [Marinobacterium stanieri]